MLTPQIVLDTNILVSGLRSRRGCAFQILTLVGTGLFDIHLSVPLVVEYQDVLGRELLKLNVSKVDIDTLLEFHCSVAKLHKIFFLWRPFLPDPKDDMVLELAVKARCDSVVTFNIRDFAHVEQFGIKAMPPAQFLQSLGGLR